jgi:uncharacterized membrane protein required for colicin V production
VALGVFVDLSIVVFLAGMAFAGWRRGLVFYAVDLAGFLASLLVALRFHAIPEKLFAPFLPPRPAATAGGLLLFIPLIAITAIFGSRLSRAMYKPGLYTTNRVLGASFGVAFGATVITITLLFARATTLPFGADVLIKRSSIAPLFVKAIAPILADVDEQLNLHLCKGRVAEDIPEACSPRR